MNLNRMGVDCCWGYLGSAACWMENGLPEPGNTECEIGEGVIESDSDIREIGEFLQTKADLPGWALLSPSMNGRTGILRPSASTLDGFQMPYGRMKVGKEAAICTIFLYTRIPPHTESHQHVSTLF